MTSETAQITKAHIAALLTVVGIAAGVFLFIYLLLCAVKILVVAAMVGFVCVAVHAGYKELFSHYKYKFTRRDPRKREY